MRVACGITGYPGVYTVYLVYSFAPACKLLGRENGPRPAATSPIEVERVVRLSGGAFCCISNSMQQRKKTLTADVSFRAAIPTHAPATPCQRLSGSSSGDGEVVPSLAVASNDTGVLPVPAGNQPPD
jgi:hypothetical protein